MVQIILKANVPRKQSLNTFTIAIAGKAVLVLANETAVEFSAPKEQPSRASEEAGPLRTGLPVFTRSPSVY
jgi:hypothetical protein